MELLPHALVFLRDGCKLLGHSTQLMGNSDEPLDELGQADDGSGLGGDRVGQCFGAEVWNISSVEAVGTPGLGQVFRHQG